MDIFFNISIKLKPSLKSRLEIEIWSEKDEIFQTKHIIRVEKKIGIERESYPNDAVMEVQSQEGGGDGVIFIEPLLEFTVNDAVDAGTTFLVEPIRKKVPES